MQRLFVLLFLMLSSVANAQEMQAPPRPNIITDEVQKIDVMQAQINDIWQIIAQLDENAVIPDDLQQRLEVLYADMNTSSAAIETEIRRLDGEVLDWAVTCTDEDSCNYAMDHMGAYTILKTIAVMLALQAKDTVMQGRFTLAVDGRIGDIH